MSAHYTVDLCENEEGWYPARCACGWGGGVYPSAEDAADALMDHAFEAGRLTAEPAREEGADTR